MCATFPIYSICFVCDTINTEVIFSTEEKKEKRKSILSKLVSKAENKTSTKIKD